MLCLVNLTLRLKGIQKPGIWNPVTDKNLNMLPRASSYKEDRRLILGRVWCFEKMLLRMIMGMMTWVLPSPIFSWQKGPSFDLYIKFLQVYSCDGQTCIFISASKHTQQSFLSISYLGLPVSRSRATMSIFSLLSRILIRMKLALLVCKSIQIFIIVRIASAASQIRPGKKAQISRSQHRILVQLAQLRVGLNPQIMSG